MERATKERLTGAVILVAALAIIVPELFSGPGGNDAADSDEGALAEPGPPLTTYDLSLDSAATPESARQQDPAKAVDKPAAIAQVVPPPVTVKPTAIAAPAATAAAAGPAPDERRDAAPRSTSSGSWWVQLGVFASDDNARRLSAELRGKGFSIEVSKVRTGDRDLHRVRAGPVADRAAAEALQKRLAAAGRQGALVAP